jgi:hypothetical protein
MKNKKQDSARLHFPLVPLTEAADTRIGKHGQIVAKILSDLRHLDEFSAIKIDLAEAGEKKADLRSALHRAAKKNKLALATTSDEQHLYVFQRQTSG